MEPAYNELENWLKENKDSFVPPICNKLMHKESQLKVMYVGGPNIRSDFHLELGEEFFYMLKGNMCLRVVEHGKFKDIKINEGEVFLLPGKTLHSPQREENTLGLVVEREREAHEFDCLRYFVDGSTDVLFEKWFFCDDLGQRLGPIVKNYMQSEQQKTGKPIPGTIDTNPPFVADGSLSMMKPFKLIDWIKNNRNNIDRVNGERMFNKSFKSDCRVLGEGGHSRTMQTAENYLFTVAGSGTLVVDDETFEMKEKSSYLVKKGQTFTLKMNPESATVSIVMNPPPK